MVANICSDAGSGDTCHPAETFLQLIGKDPAQTWFRTVTRGTPANRRRRGRDLHGFDAAALEADNRAGDGVYFITGDANQATGENKQGKPTGCVTDGDVHTCRAVFVEWDGPSIEWQLTAWQELGLPEPTAMVATGGKSVHCYWQLFEPITPERWEPLQKRLIEHAGGDKACKNPSRLMRLPGFHYIDKATGKVTDNVAELIHRSIACYTPDELEACLPPLPAAPAPAAPRPTQQPVPAAPAGQPRSIDEINTAAAFIPRRVGGEGTYESDRNALCGCSAALEEAGHPSPDAAALALLGHLWPSEAAAGQVLRSATTRNAGSFWGIAREHGYDLKRSAPQLPEHRAAPATTKAQPAPAPAPQLMSLAAVRQQLQEAIADGIGGSDLAALITELADAADRHHTTVQRLADAIRAEQLQSAAVAAEARQLACEADRRELGQMLTPAYLLPPAIAGAIETRSRYLPCEGPSAVLPFLAAAAGLVKLGTEVEGSAVAGYRVPVNLFACLVGRSGAKKSPIGRLLVEAPTAELRAELARANQRDRADWEEACRETKKGEAKPPEPRPKRLMVSDFTGEALAAQLQTQEAAGLGLLVNRDELSGLFGSLNQYRGGRGADEQQLLELFDGSGLSSLRIVGDRHYNRSQLSVWGSTQPDVLRQLVAGGDASGLWARFLFVPLPERVVPLPMNTTPAEVAEVEAASQTLAEACAAIYRLPRQTYRLAPGAAAAFGRYELQRQQAALSATIGAQSALYGKSAGKVLRVAGVLHLLQIVAGVINSDAAIEEDTIERGTALVDHLDAWALSLHAEAAAGGVAGLMHTVHKAAEEAGGTIRWKDLAMKLSAKGRRETDGAGFAQAARALEEAGYGEVETGQRGSIRYRATGRLP